MSNLDDDPLWWCVPEPGRSARHLPCRAFKAALDETRWCGRGKPVSVALVDHPQDRLHRAYLVAVGEDRAMCIESACFDIDALACDATDVERVADWLDGRGLAYLVRGGPEWRLADVRRPDDVVDWACPPRTFEHPLFDSEDVVLPGPHSFQIDPARLRSGVHEVAGRSRRALELRLHWQYCRLELLGAGGARTDVPMPFRPDPPAPEMSFRCHMRADTLVGLAQDARSTVTVAVRAVRTPAGDRLVLSALQQCHIAESGHRTHPSRRRPPYPTEILRIVYGEPVGGVIVHPEPPWEEGPLLPETKNLRLFMG